MGQREAPKTGRQRMIRQSAGNVTGPPQGLIGRDAQDQIGRQLRALYDEILDEPIPERFVNLLMELKRKGEEPK
jgi:Anti-sigma factor NepR